MLIAGKAWHDRISSEFDASGNRDGSVRLGASLKREVLDHGGDDPMVV